MTPQKIARILGATCVAAVIAYGPIVFLKIAMVLTAGPDYFRPGHWQGVSLFVLLQMLGLCYAIKIFGGDIIFGDQRSSR
jgi:hypothetical protein